MRADAFAIWLVPRPAAEVIPAGVHEVAVFVDHFDRRAFAVNTVSARQKVRKLVAFIDSRQIVQPGVAKACPALGVESPLLGLRFMSAAGTTPLARAVEDGCGDLSFSIRGHRERGLTEDADLTEMLWKLGALPACRAARLRGSATLPARSPAPPSIGAQLNFRNVSSATCSLRGFARLGLRDANGRRLPSRVEHSAYPPHAVILTPHASAWIALQWPVPSPSCKARAAASADVTLPGEKRKLGVPVGSATHPCAPCHGVVRADAVG